MTEPIDMHLEGRIDSLEQRFERTSEAIFGKIDKVTEAVSSVATEVKRQGTEMRSNRGAPVWQWIAGLAGAVAVASASFTGLFFLIDARAGAKVEVISAKQQHAEELAKVRVDYERQLSEMRLQRVESAIGWKANIQ